MEKTNLDRMKEIFPKADFDIHLDLYDTGFNGYSIEWIENEFFVVNRTYLDLDVGYVTDTDLFSGNFDECLEYIKKLAGVEL